MIKFKVIFFLIIIITCSSCVKISDLKNNRDSLNKFNLATIEANDYIFEIKKAEILNDFQKEFERATTLSQNQELSHILFSANYKKQDKIKLSLESLNRAILYGTLALNVENRSEIASFHAKQNIAYNVENLLYQYYFLSQLYKDDKILETEKNLIKKELNNIELNYIALVGSYKYLNENQMILPNDFYDIPQNLLLESLNSRQYLPVPYSQDFIDIAKKVIAQMPPYNTIYEEVLNINSLLFKIPSLLYKNYYEDMTIQLDVMTVFIVIALNCEVNLIVKQIEELEKEYILLKNEYDLISRKNPQEASAKYYAYKRIELERFEMFLFLRYFIKTKSLQNQLSMPKNISLLLEKVAIDLLFSVD